MSDNKGTPAAASTAAPEANKGWSEQDRRNLIITIAGGLAANLGTVILVGLAIAAVRLSRHQYHSRFPAWYLPLMLVLGVLGLFLIVIGNRERGSDRFNRFNGWIQIVMGSLLVLAAVLISTGLAAGVK